MADDGLLKKGLGQVGNLGKQIGKGIVEEAKKTKEATKQQVGFEQQEKKAAAELEKLGEDDKKRIEGIKKDENKQFVMGLYGKTDNKKVNDQQREVMVETAEANQEKTPEEIQKIAQLRQALHGDYYQQLIHPPKQPEEKPQERVERLDKEEEQKKMEFMKKEEKKKPVVPGPPKGPERRPGAG